MQTEAEREAIFLANTLVENQPSPEAAGIRRIVRSRMIACADCGERYRATQLDISTGLCEVCNEVGGLENCVQDGAITEEEFVRQAVELGYKGSAVSAEERAAYAAREGSS